LEVLCLSAVYLNVTHFYKLYDAQSKTHFWVLNDLTGFVVGSHRYDAISTFDPLILQKFILWHKADVW